MARAVGVGGVFLKAQDPKALSAWYAKHFGIASADKTSLLFDGPSAAGMTVFAHFPRDTEYSQQAGQQVPQQAMVNLRVDNLDEMLAQLAADGVSIDPKREDYPYGRFAWIIDPEGNRVELWEPPAPESESP
jgi:predicted enzyme related to lactoylglutathione lyase